MPPLNNRIHACIQRVMLSFDDFSIKRRYKEKTVRIIKISLVLQGNRLCSPILPGQCFSRMDLMNRVADTMEHKFIDGFTNVVNLISLFMTIAGLLIVLITQIAWVALIIIAVAIPLLYLSFISGKATYEANKEITKYQRKYKYLTTVMTGRENVDERTVFGYNEKLNDKWFEQYEISRKMETRTRAKWFVKLKSGSMITAFLCTFIAAMLINPVATGIITIGMLCK